MKLGRVARWPGYSWSVKKPASSSRHFYFFSLTVTSTGWAVARLVGV
jgi:hypothetical protein